MNWEFRVKRLVALSLLVLGLVVALPAQQITDADTLASFHITSGHRVVTTLTPLASGGVRVEFDVDADHYTLDLQPFSVRSPLYTVYLDNGNRDVLETVPAAPECTYRGIVVGDPTATVAASVLPGGVYARILYGNGTDQWIQPMSSQVPNAPASTGVFYNGSDVLPNPNTACTELTVPANAQTPSGILAPNGGDFNVCEIACDADYDYYKDYGSSQTAVQNRINTVLNAMNLQYQSQVNITHQITAIVIRTTRGSNYKGKNASSILSKFRRRWLNDHGGIQRDIAHLFTGKNLSGGTIGIAWLSVICNTNYGYGLVESDFTNNFACTTDLSAHELGHNWSAGHCSCSSNTMNAYITCANSFSSVSINSIVAHRNGAGCLN